jgi:predicted nucleotidyltransferase
MKTLDQIRKVLREHKGEFTERFKVSKLGIFGSYARGDHGEESDLDVIVEFTQPVGFEFIHLANRLEELVGVKVDLLTPDSIKANRRESILRNVVDVTP